MSDEILRDCFRSMGLDNVTPFHVRALDAFFGATAALGFSNKPEALRDAGFRGDIKPSHVQKRLWNDMSYESLDAVHAAAQWDDAEMVARGSGKKVRKQRERSNRP